MLNAEITKKTKYLLISLSVWILLQIPRLIAIPIINDVLNKIDEGAWLYPAILDVVVAILSPFAIYFIWKKRNHITWTFLIVYFIISIIDHGNAVTASKIAKIPQTFKEMGAQEASFTPIWQSIIDIFAITTLYKLKTKNIF